MDEHNVASSHDSSKSALPMAFSADGEIAPVNHEHLLRSTVTLDDVQYLHVFAGLFPCSFILVMKKLTVSTVAHFSHQRKLSRFTSVPSAHSAAAHSPTSPLD